MEEFALSALRQLWTFIVVALLVYQLGVTSKGIAAEKGWRGPHRIYDLTLRMHPLLSFVFGFLPLPTLDAIDALTGAELIVARCAWFMLAGALCGQVYEIIKFGVNWMRLRAGLKAAGIPMASDIEVVGDVMNVEPPPSDPGGES